jgi:signal transduction histidine kinase
VTAVLMACTRGGREWVPVLVEASDEELFGIPVAAAYRWPVVDIGRLCREGDGYLGFHQVIDRVRVARHDINNPLAAALAETQLLLMDATDPEMRRALEAIQAQLRRIATLVSGLAFAPPSPPPEFRP